jgi:hypothetical protein
MKTLQQLTITKLKLICKENNLIYKKKFKKVDYINFIISYYKTNSIKLNEQSTETKEKFPLFVKSIGYLGDFIANEWISTAKVYRNANGITYQNDPCSTKQFPLLV